MVQGHGYKDLQEITARHNGSQNNSKPQNTMDEEDNRPLKAQNEGEEAPEDEEDDKKSFLNLYGLIKKKKGNQN